MCKEQDMRGLAWAIVKEDKVWGSGSVPAAEHAAPSEIASLGYYKRMAADVGGDLYVGKIDGTSNARDQDGLIFGMSWDEIRAMQQGKKVPTELKARMPAEPVLVYVAGQKACGCDGGCSDTGGPHLVPAVVKELLGAAAASAARLRQRVSQVRLGPIEGDLATILFSFDEQPMQGYLRGRNKDAFVYGDGRESDMSWAVRVMLDGDAVMVAGSTNLVLG